jgi:outer membrane receptor protein involved in Fe transport
MEAMPNKTWCCARWYWLITRSADLVNANRFFVELYFARRAKIVHLPNISAKNAFSWLAVRIRYFNVTNKYNTKILYMMLNYNLLKRAAPIMLTAFWLLSTGALRAQTSITVSGTMRDADNGETLIGASVEALTLRKGNVSNEYGFYSFSLPNNRDSVTLRFSYIGYDEKLVRISAQRDIKLDIELRPSGTLLQEVTIVANPLIEKVKSTEMSVMTLSAKEAKALPALFGETDLLKIIQLKPGVASGSEGTTGIFVRGGGNDQNLIVLDEAVVYNPNHLFGFFSTFNPDAVKDLKIWKGGFPAQYGGRLSSVIDVRMKEGNNKQYDVAGGLGLISSRLTVEGPIVKDKASFIVSGRRTYADLITAQINKAQENNENFNPIPDYYFYDLNTKVNFEITPKDRIYLSGYFGRDVFKFTNESFNFLFDWGNTTGTARWNHTFGPKLFSNLTYTHSDYRYRIRNILQGFSFRLGSNIVDDNIKLDFYYQPNNQHTIRFGGNFTLHEFEVGRLRFGSDDGSFNFEAGETFNGNEYALFVADDWAVTDRLKLNFGGRFSGWVTDTVQYQRFEPRVAANFAVTDNWSLKASYARMNQYVHLLASSGLSLPTDIWYPTSGNVKPETSDQIAVGTTFLLGKNVLVTYEAWYKWLDNQIDFIDGAELFGQQNIETQLTFGDGFAYSPLELEIEKKDGALTGWIGYTLSWVKRGRFPVINRGEYFSPRFDTRHNFTAVALYQIPTDNRWLKRLQFTASFVYTSGNISWLPSGRFTFQDVPGGQTQTVVPVFGDRNTFRYPAYMRGDLGIVYKWKTRRSEQDLTLSIYNVTDRRNPYFLFIDVQTENVQVGDGSIAVPTGFQARQVSLFPILPSITWNFKF